MKREGWVYEVCATVRILVNLGFGIKIAHILSTLSIRPHATVFSFSFYPFCYK